MLYRAWFAFFTLGMLSFSAILESKVKSVGIVINSIWTGEYSFALRLESACKNLGWNVTFLDSENKTHSKKKFDWILTLIPTKKDNPNFSYSPNYLVLFDPINHYYDAECNLREEFSNYFGYLCTFKGPLYEKIRNHKRAYPYPWFPTSQYRPYREVVPKRLFYFLGQWGNRLYDAEYKALERCLAEKSYICFFGNPDYGLIYGESYKGFIPFAGESIQDQIAESGVCLVLHSDIHNKYGIPSGRIFEALAASSVIISDRNPFVKKHFGDSVLYIDQTRSGEEMFSEVDIHMQWILSHEEEAQKMAKRAYEIFCKNFLLEDQLLNFDKWHQFNLRCPLVIYSKERDSFNTLSAPRVEKPIVVNIN